MEFFGVTRITSDLLALSARQSRFSKVSRKIAQGERT